MTQINDIKGDGFILRNADGSVMDMAGISLRTSLKAFFRTFQCVEPVFSSFTDNDSKKAKNSEQLNQLHYSSSYLEACTEAILHFQHFAELVLKNFLRLEHPLLADIASTDPVVFYKLLKNKDLTTDEEKGIRTIEFSEAIERVYKLITNGYIGHKNSLDFIKEARRWLKVINTLRNRLWHRGSFILHYPALDKLFGEYILPFVQQVNSLPEYSSLHRWWKYAPLDCGIDPVSEIIRDFKTGTYNLQKIALLKELGRAAYEKPTSKREMIYGDEGRAKAIAELEKQYGFGLGGVERIKRCPVCGISSLMLFYDTEDYTDYYFENEQDREACEPYKYVYRIKCTFCTLELGINIGLPSDHGLPLEDYWQAEKL